MKYYHHIILDRDGVLNQSIPGEYITDYDKWSWIFRSKEALALLKILNIRVSIATNQACIGHGLLSPSSLEDIHRQMQDDLRKHEANIHKIYTCPHKADDFCDCRKPCSGLLLRAIEESGIDRSNTIFIGDSITDMQAAHRAGIDACLVRTAYNQIDEQKVLELEYPILIFNDLWDVVQAIFSTHSEEDIWHFDVNELLATIKLAEKTLDPSLLQAIALCNQQLQKGGKIILCGNGGSAADAIHFSAELVGRFEENISALPAIVLGSDIACLTAISNDFGFDRCFVRQIQALGSRKDVLIAISTSGRSSNIINAVNTAKSIGMPIIALTGFFNSPLRDKADICLAIPSTRTARIQELHNFLLHLIASGIEKYHAK